jgi:spectinomycin phosphotransferase
MRHRPNVDDSELRSAVHDRFDLQLRALAFLPLGEGSWAYRGEDQAGQNWFVKLSRTDTTAVAQVTVYLRDMLGLTFVLAPIVGAGSAEPKIKEYYLTVYPFAEGKVLGSADLAPYKAEIGSDLLRLHEARLPERFRALLPQEPFDEFQASAQEYVARARAYTGNDALLQRLATDINLRAAAINTVIENGQLLSDYCRRQAHTYELVVCHADIHPFNIMATSQGLLMLDWDAIMLAPRERDLMFYAGDMRSSSDFHRAYGSGCALNEDLITYYAYEWVLQEWTDYIGRLFDIGLRDAARRHALDEFELLFGKGGELGGVVKDALDAPLPSAAAFYD